MHRNPLTFFCLLLCWCLNLKAQEIPVAGFQIPLTLVEPGERACIDITATDFSSVMGMEWGLKWDEVRLQFDTVINLSLPNLSLREFNLLRTDEGFLRLSWFSLPDPELPDSLRLFTLCFTVKENAAPGFAHISFDESLGRTEIFTRPANQTNPFILGNFTNGGFIIRDSTDGPPLTVLGNSVAKQACLDGGSSIELDVSGGTPPYDFTWSGPGGFVEQSANILGLEEGNYTVTVTDDNGNFAIGDFLISILQEDYEYPDITGDFIVGPAACGESNGSIELNNGDYYLDWSDGELVNKVAGLAAGDFAATVTNRRTCEVQEITITVGEAGDRIEYDLSIEYDACTSTFGRVQLEILTPGNYEFTWPEMDRTSLDSLPLGNYEITITELDSGCVTVIPVEVEGPPFFEIEASPEILPISCQDSIGTITMNVLQEGNYAFDWSTGESSSMIEVTTPGVYLLTVTDVDIQCSQIFELEMFEEPFQVKGEIVIEAYDCSDGSSLAFFEVDNAEDYDFLWSTGDTGQTLHDQVPGNYSLTITDNATGCFAVRTAEIPEGDSPLSVSIDIECIEESTCSNYALFSANVEGGSGLYRFDWSTGETADSLSTSFIRVDDQRGYAVVVTDLNTGCRAFADLLTATCLSGLPTQELRLRLYFTCEDEEETPVALLHAEVFSGGVPPYVFSWNSGQVDTSYYLSSIPFSTELSRAEVTVTDQAGNIANWGVDRTELYGCGNEDNAVHFAAPHVVVAPGESFRYPVTAFQYKHLARGILTLDWDNCLLRADSLIDYTIGGLNGEPYYLAPAEWLLQGTWEVGFGSFSFPEDMPDTAIVQELFFTAREGTEGISPFIFSINEPGIFEDGSTAFLRPHHGSITIAEIAQLVAPGDSDDNGRVDHFDLLNLGLFYREAGPDRRLGLTGLQEEYGIPWSDSTPRSRVNLRYLDCNGDGVIDDLDAPVIGNNWDDAGEPWQWPGSFPVNKFDGSPDAVPLLVLGDSIVPGQLNEVNIVLGTATELVTAAYGLAFTLEYDPQAVDPESVDLMLDGGWFNGGDPDNVLELYRNDARHHRVEVAITRTDGTDLAGSGPIASLRFAAREELAPGDEAEFRFLGVKLIDHLENEVNVATPVASVTISSTGSTSVRNNQLVSRVRLFPVPASGHLYLQTDRLSVQRLQLLDVSGAILKEWGPLSEIEVHDLAPAVYFLRLMTTEGPVVKRWIKQ